MKPSGTLELRQEYSDLFSLTRYTITFRPQDRSEDARHITKEVLDCELVTARYPKLHLVVIASMMEMKWNQLYPDMPIIFELDKKNECGFKLEWRGDA